MIRFLFVSIVCLAQSLSAMNTAVVIGAGASGLAAAQLMQSRGIRVVILENSHRIGGKLFTVPCNNGRGGKVELGAIQVGIGYPIVNNYRKECGLKLRKYWSSQVLLTDKDGDKPVYRNMSDYYWPRRDSIKIAQEVITMNNALKRFAPINDSHYTEIPEDSEFILPFETWAKSHNLDHFLEDYRIWLTSYGYGQLSDIPTFLGLNLINSSMGLVFLRKFDMNVSMLADGYGGLINGMVDHYGLDVRTGVKIENINRFDDHVTVSYHDEHEGFVTLNADHLVVACGIDCIGKLFTRDEITTEEKTLMDDLRFSPYDVVIAHIPELKKGGYVVPENLKRPGHVSLISKNSAQGDDVILYIPRAGVASLASSIPRPSENELIARVKEDMADFGLSVEEIYYVQYWDNYFPHFAHATSYALADSIQGRNRTVYVGSFARFEIVERAMEHAHDVVREHILNEEEPRSGFFSSLRRQIGALYEYATANDKDHVNNE